MRLLKKLPGKLKAIITTLDREQYDSINLYFQDESRFGLMTKQKRVLVSKGIKPIGKFQHSYKWVWLWGCFSPISGDAFYWETPYVSNKIFEAFLQDFSQQNPGELKIVIIDNAGFHAVKHIKVPGSYFPDAPLSFSVRLKFIFFKIKPTCLKEMDSTMSSSTTLSASNLKLQRP